VSVRSRSCKGAKKLKVLFAGGGNDVKTQGGHRCGAAVNYPISV